ncbi:MAG TPA: glycosyltransferase family 2 protein [Nevskiales bacterium]|nr:glycosyltransferase family 2 protein [Nevskiales bacterium]
MLLSIIVPSFNQARFIPATLDSILAQDYRPVEVIVVDGGSTDATVDILREYAARYPELRWLSEPDNGPADAVNKGLALARGEIAAIQSSDDIYYPGAFSAVMREYAAHPDCGFLIGHYCGIDLEGRVLYTERLPEFSWEAYFGLALCIPQSSIFFRMSVAREVGGWNSAYYGCDLDYWLRLLLRTRAIRLDRVLSGWRLYPGARTHSGQQRKIWDGYWRMIDDNRDLRLAPARVQRLARASRHILALRFHPTGNRWSIRWHLLLGLLQHPSFWRYHRLPDLARFLPGYHLARTIYHRLRQLCSCSTT